MSAFGAKQTRRGGRSMLLRTILASSNQPAFNLGLLLQLEDMPSHRVEPLFDDLTEKWSLLSGQCRVNLRNVVA
jgi:hypothetical protein